MIIINNDLTNKERKDLIKFSQPYLKNFGPDYPGKQTDGDISKYFPFKDIHYKILSICTKKLKLSLEISRSWINLTNGRKGETYWHNHPSDYTLVYFIQTLPFFNSGTLLREKFIRVKQNGIVLFPGKTEHAAPSYPFPFFDRYSLAMELNIISNG